MATVKLKNIEKVYDNKVVAVQDFNLEVKDKEFVVLVGPSGCGKSTTLRMVAGLEEVTKGELYIDEKLVNETPPKERNVAMVFQYYALYPHMSAYDNMAFSLKLSKEDHKIIDEKVKQAAEILNITHLLNRKPRELSGGERQRVAIGRAIVRDPKVFLMDEPLSNLDAKLRNQMRAEIIKLRQRIDTTFIYVTHDQTEAMTLGDRLVIMKDGFIKQIGTADDVFNKPANQFVASFIGVPQMNFLPVELTLTEDNYVVSIYGQEITLPDEMQQLLHQKKQSSGSVILGVRPEHINIVSKDTPNSITGRVEVSEMMGSEVFIHATVESAEIVIRVPVISADLPEFKSGGHDDVHFVIPPKYIHLFDEASEENLIV